ncbi:MAG: hypothetical protein ACT60Q_05205, partial [Ferrovibrionaceae bacterium]
MSILARPAVAGRACSNSPETVILDPNGDGDFRLIRSIRAAGNSAPIAAAVSRKSATRASL